MFPDSDTVLPGTNLQVGSAVIVKVILIGSDYVVNVDPNPGV